MGKWAETEEAYFGRLDTQEGKSMEMQYAFPCGGCICNHCANSVECWDDCTGEMEVPCFICDECINFDGQGRRQNRTECGRYKITNKYAEYLRKKFRVNWKR